jgi:hypothetical protein
VGSSDGLAVLRALKFESFGRHPLESHDLNLIEQINQTWTYLVSLRALTSLFERHPEAGGFKLSLDTRSGTEIMSLVPCAFAAETFAATTPRSYRKLTKDVRKLLRDCPEARARYVFFAAPVQKPQRLLENGVGYRSMGDRYPRSHADLRRSATKGDSIAMRALRRSKVSCSCAYVMLCIKNSFALLGKRVLRERTGPLARSAGPTR